MKSIVLQIAGFIAVAGGIGFVIYSDDRVVGLMITVLAAGLLLIGFGAVLSLLWLGSRMLMRALIAPPPARPQTTRSGRPAVPAYSVAESRR
jgi:hypothetical protein